MGTSYKKPSYNSITLNPSEESSHVTVCTHLPKIIRFPNQDVLPNMNANPRCLWFACFKIPPWWKSKEWGEVWILGKSFSLRPTSRELAGPGHTVGIPKHLCSTWMRQLDSKSKFLRFYYITDITDTCQYSWAAFFFEHTAGLHVLDSLHWLWD